MLVVHAAECVLPLPGGKPVEGGAVAVDDGRIAAIGPDEEVLARYPGARIRRWSGVLTSGLVNRYGPELLEATYHPDPMEYDKLGELPLTGAELAALEMNDYRWAESARRGLHQMMRRGAIAVAGPLTRSAVRIAVHRSGMTLLDRPEPPPGPPSLDPLRDASLAAAGHVPLVAGNRADFAVFAATGPQWAAGPGSCLATVLAGRLVFRRT